MDLADIVNITGLSLDIIGAALLFRFGLPSEVKESSDELIMEESIEEENERNTKNKNIKRIAYCSLGLIILGFAFQLAANLIDSFSQ